MAASKRSRGDDPRGFDCEAGRLADRRSIDVSKMLNCNCGFGIAIVVGSLRVEEADARHAPGQTGIYLPQIWRRPIGDLVFVVERD